MLTTRRSFTVLGAALAAPALAQPGFPTRQVRLIVAASAGSGGDIVARLVADPMRDDLGQLVIVDNRPGASGNTGAEAVFRAPADGYSILVTAGAFAISPSVLRHLPFDPVRDFTGVALLAAVPVIVVVRPESPFRNIADIVAAARTRGAAISYASFGIATPPHLIGERIGLEAGQRMTHVPYRVSAQAFPDIISGALDFAILDAVAMTPHITAGRLRALALNGTQRAAALPDVPTLREAGIGFDAVGWHGVFALAATPPPIINRLNAAFTAAVAQPRVRQAIISGGAIPIDPPLSAAEWTARFRREVTAWGEVARAAGVEVE
ncbi:MAG: tripartite tricarboxylate transporter substrate binding protein [Roseomonas sp.]|nr:tripartite tricarboxylate transporter substrate binding protein [Roseomonas sp.]MCA3378990.1 tripartite tricarboxylate transporter substrate binding protein [Roseomonas sp.]